MKENYTLNIESKCSIIFLRSIFVKLFLFNENLYHLQNIVIKENLNIESMHVAKYRLFDNCIFFERKNSGIAIYS